MGRPCTICTHPKAREIDRALMNNALSMREIAHMFDVNVDSVQRHKGNHLAPRLNDARTVELDRLAARGEADASPPSQTGALGDLASLRDRVLVLLESAERQGNARTTLAAIKELRGVLDSIARVSGEDKGRAPQVNILASEGWLTVQTTIVAALEPWPEARTAVVTALGAVPDGI